MLPLGAGGTIRLPVVFFGRSRSAKAEELYGNVQSRKMVIRYRTRLIVLLTYPKKKRERSFRIGSSFYGSKLHSADCKKKVKNLKWGYDTIKLGKR